MGTKTFDIKKHKSYLDVIRILAILLVYFAHTGERGAQHFTIEGGVFSYFTSMTLYSVDLSGPYFFFAISGGLLLAREVNPDHKEDSQIPYHHFGIQSVPTLLRCLYSLSRESGKSFHRPFKDDLRICAHHTVLVFERIPCVPLPASDAQRSGKAYVQKGF